MKHILEELNWDGIDFVIETGTHHGASSKTFKEFCEKVYTIEISQRLYDEYSPRLLKLGINCIRDTSVAGISFVLNREKGDYLIFLDAHGSGGDTEFDPRVGRFGAPILEELQACAANPPKVIIVDDYLDVMQLDTYPNPDEIVAEVAKLGDYEIHLDEKNRYSLVCVKK